MVYLERLWPHHVVDEALPGKHCGQADHTAVVASAPVYNDVLVRAGPGIVLVAVQGEDSFV